MSQKSIAAKLRSSLNQITDELSALIRKIPVEYHERLVGQIPFAGPEYYWGERTAKQSSVQLDLKRRFDRWAELLKIALKGAPEDVIEELRLADEQYRIWLQLESNWCISQNPDETQENLKNDVRQLEKLLDVLDANGEAKLIVVPDTNSIVGEPDPTKYRTSIGTTDFIFLLLPTVLSELDELKNHHRNPDFRDKAKKVIDRIKGWRKQGPLSTGVTVDHTITVQTIANEPDLKSSLSWLCSDVRDDRIIASVLEVQSANPVSRVVLVTGDINLQNKADVAMIECVDL